MRQAKPTQRSCENKLLTYATRGEVTCVDNALGKGICYCVTNFHPFLHCLNRAIAKMYEMKEVCYKLELRGTHGILPHVFVMSILITFPEARKQEEETR